MSGDNSYNLFIEDKGNNKWDINGEIIYAPNEITAVRRYLKKTGDHKTYNDYMQLLKDLGQKRERK